MNAFESLRNHGVTRLCHFTKLQSLTHIFSSIDGISASKSIRSDIKNVTDVARYDGELDYICCSVEYPNSWFLDRAKQGNKDNIFKEWCVLYIDLSILNLRDAKFCPCNASTQYGNYIGSDVECLFSNPISCKRIFYRTATMLPCCPTDGQAEILIKGSVPRERIIGIAVGDDNEASMVYAMMKTFHMEPIPIYMAADVLTPKWSDIIKHGNRPKESLCVWKEEE